MTFANMLLGTMELATASVALLIVSVIECMVVSRFLLNKNLDIKVFYVVLASNAISSLFGLIGLLSWVVDVLKNPIKQILGIPPDGTSPYFSIAITIIAFVLTLPFETLTNVIFLKRNHPVKQIVKSTFYSNSLTYALLGGILLIVVMNAV